MLGVIVLSVETGFLTTNLAGELGLDCGHLEARR